MARYLVCTACSLSLSLPVKGVLSPLGESCPVCHFQLVRVGSAESDGFVVCPFCYNNPSGKNGVDIEDLCLGETLPCFKCHAACAHASEVGVGR